MQVVNPGFPNGTSPSHSRNLDPSLGYVDASEEREFWERGRGELKHLSIRRRRNQRDSVSKGD